MSEALCSTSETNIMLYINHTLLKKIIIICMKLEGKEYQPITPTGQRCKQWRVDLEGQWRQDHGASSLCEALPGFFRWVRLNTGISHFFFFNFSANMDGEPSDCIHTVWDKQRWAVSPACMSLGFSRCSFIGKKTGTFTREELQVTVRGSTFRWAEGGQELERLQSQAWWPEQRMPCEEAAA